MGACKECGEVFGVLEMTNGICKNCVTPENIIKAKVEDKKAREKKEAELNKLGFQWWTTWAWLGLILGNLYIVYLLFIGIYANLSIYENIFLIGSNIINTVLMIYVLKYNKYAFLIATVLALNPLLWIINGIYLKNRWDHPKVNQHNIDVIYD